MDPSAWPVNTLLEVGSTAMHSTFCTQAETAAAAAAAAAAAEDDQETLIDGMAAPTFSSW
jgi:hypothetical protein